jgi:hypothetical protein
MNKEVKLIGTICTIGMILIILAGCEEPDWKATADKYKGEQGPVKMMTVKDLAAEYAKEHYGATEIQHLETLKGDCPTCYAVDLYIDQTIYMRVYIKDNMATNEELFEEVTEIEPVKLKIVDGNETWNKTKNMTNSTTLNAVASDASMNGTMTAQTSTQTKNSSNNHQDQEEVLSSASTE